MTRVLVLGIDAANADLIEHWSGRLPNLTRLKTDGTFVRTEGLRDFFVGSTWPSFYTGLTPANHGHHSLVQLEPGTYRYRRMADGPLLNGTPLWEQLSNAGRRVAVMDVPLSQAPASINGIQTVEWGGHDALYGFETCPPSLRAEIERRFGTHPLGPSCDGERKSADDYRAFVDKLIRGARTKGEITRWLLSEHEWEFAMQVFTEAHCAGHQAWHLHDKSHPAHPSDIVTDIGDPLRAVYEAVDSAIGAILEDISDETIVLVVSAHSMSYWYGAQFLMPQVLEALGVAVSPEPVKAPVTFRSTLRRAAVGAWMSLPDASRDVLRPLLRRAQAATPSEDPIPTLGVDTDRSLCFGVFNGQPVGGIRLNVEGREPNGQLSPGDVDQFCQALRADLMAVRDTRTGLPAFRDVVRTRDHLAGRELGALPDLLVHWSDTIPTGSTVVGSGKSARVTLESDKIGRISGSNAYGRTGEHRPEGFCIVRDANRPGRSIDRPISLLDLAPTIMAYFDETLDECDGTPIEELLT